MTTSPSPIRGSQKSINTHNDADQLVSERIQSGGGWTDVAYSYNANGCLTSSVSSASSVVYQYDYDNRLVTVDDASSFVSYLYDASGARIGRIHNSVTNYFVTDQSDALKRPLAETDASGNIIRFYVWNGSQLLCHIDANGTVRYYHSDELGSTLALTDSSGNVTDQFAYMPYGYANHSGSTSTPFQWLGGYGVYYDSDTDLHLTLHRAYSAKMKRFIHPDPLGIDGGVNVYAMANLNPLFFVDPTGEFGIIGAAIGGFIGGIIGGGAAYIRGDSILAGVAGGAVAGAFVGSGAGVVAAAVGAGTLSAGGAIGTMALVGASGSVMGNTTEQVVRSMESGMSFNQSLSDVDMNQQLVSGAIGAVSGAVSGGGIMLNHAVNTATQQGNQMLSNYMVSMSETLMPMTPGSQPAINAIQQQIMQSMSQQGLNAVQITTLSSALFLLGTEVGEEYANPYNYGPRK